MAEHTCKKCGVKFKGSPRRQFCSHLCSAGFKRVGINRKHGLAGKDREYLNWAEMRHRCTSKDPHKWSRYGARGIKVCERWATYANFLADMGPRPGPEYTIDRIDNDGDYEPGNCRWATRTEQNRNKSNTYTPEQDAKIRECVALGYDFTKMAQILGKSRGSVSTRTYKIGLKSGRPPDPKKVRSGTNTAVGGE